MRLRALFGWGMAGALAASGVGAQSATQAAQLQTPTQTVLEALKPLASLVGRWKISGRMMVTQAQWDEAQGFSEIRAALDGAFLREDYEMTFGGTHWKVICLRSWDQFQNIYRVGYFDNQMGLFDVYEGALREGALEVSNLKPNTFFMVGPLKFHTRNRVYDITSDRFKMDWIGSVDGGKTWFPAGTLIYTRAETQQETKSKQKAPGERE